MHIHAYINQSSKPNTYKTLDLNTNLKNRLGKLNKHISVKEDEKEDEKNEKKIYLVNFKWIVVSRIKKPGFREKPYSQHPKIKVFIS